MNATFFLISAACLAGADPAPAPAPAAPAVVVGSAGCGGCGAAPSCDPCGHTGFFTKLKARLHCHKSSCCAPAPSCAPKPVACAPAPCAPAPVACAPACAPAPCAPACKPHCSLHLNLFHGSSSSACGCGTAKVSLFDKIRARFHHSSCDACASPCSTGPAMVAPVGPTVPPKEMPPPPKEDPKPKTTALAPITPLVDVGGTAGKY